MYLIACTLARSPGGTIVPLKIKEINSTAIPIIGIGLGFFKVVPINNPKLIETNTKHTMA